VKPTVLAAVPLLVELVADIESGRVTDAFAVSRKLAALAVDLLPVDTLKPYLTERDRNWADAAVDIAEALKVNAAADAAELEKLGES
jgi:hypothetical protein